MVDAETPGRRASALPQGRVELREVRAHLRSNSQNSDDACHRDDADEQAVLDEVLPFLVADEACPHMRHHGLSSESSELKVSQRRSFSRYGRFAFSWVKYEPT